MFDPKGAVVLVKKLSTPRMFIFGLFAILLSPLASGQQHIGNGGDPLMMLFLRAQTDAEFMLRQLKADGVPDSIDKDVRDFLGRLDGHGATVLERMAENTKNGQHPRMFCRS